VIARAQIDREILEAFGARLLSTAGATRTYVIACVDRAQAEDVRASLTIAGVHVPADHNRDSSTYVYAYVHEQKGQENV
jgi:hypothetical protein